MEIEMFTVCALFQTLNMGNQCAEQRPVENTLTLTLSESTVGGPFFARESN
jgi:hypothetical protein